MKTTFFLSLWLCLWLSMTGHARTAATTGDDDKPQMRLLFLGNSFSLDASHMLPQQLEDAGVNTRQYTIDCVMYAGATLEYWCQHIREDRPIKYRFHMGGKLATGDSCRTVRELLGEPWDVVIIQQASRMSDKEETYEPHRDSLCRVIRTLCPQARIAWLLTWSVAPYFTHGPVDRAGWEKIADIARTHCQADGIDLVIPAGTALQTARQTSLNDGRYLTRDGIHLVLGTGRYIAAMCVFETVCRPVFGTSCLDLPPSQRMKDVDSKYGDDRIPITDDNYPLCKACVAQALADPYRLPMPNDTDSTGPHIFIDSKPARLPYISLDGRRSNRPPKGGFIYMGKKYVSR